MKCVSRVAILAGAILVFFSFGPAWSSDAGPSAENGKKLFNDPHLSGSTNKRSCNSCHPDGEGLENAGSKEDIKQTINVCIRRPLRGKVLDLDSVEMESLVLYIKSLGQ